MECFEGDGNKTPEAEDRSAEGQLSQLILSTGLTQECEGLSDSSTICIEEATHLPSLDDYTDMWMCIESSIDKFVKGVATKQMVDLVKEDVRRFKAKGYCNLNEDEVSELQNNFTFLARLESTPSHFRERALALAEEIPSQIQRLSQIQGTLIEKPNLEEEKMCIMAEIEKEMQARLLRIQQLDETAEIITGENAQRAELKEELITRMRDLWHRVNKASTYSLGLSTEKKRRRI